MTTPFPVVVDAEPSPPKTVLPEMRTLPSHLAGETVMPGTDWRDEEAVWMTALSALEANTSMEGTENRGTGGISPGRYPGTVGTVSVEADGEGVDVAALCEAAGSWGLEAAQAPRVRVVAARSVRTVREERAAFMPSV